MDVVYVLVLLWVLPNGEVTEWKAGTYGKMRHCLSHLTYIRQRSTPIKEQHLRCKRLSVQDLLDRHKEKAQ